MTTAILVLAGVICTSLGSYAGVRYGARKNAETSIAAAMLASQATMLESQRKDFDLILEPIRTEIRDLRTEVATLSAALDTVRRVKNAAVEHIRRLIVWAHAHLPGAELPPLPDILTDEV
jgi:outer membrane murein-binding lipoprotein Lpp